jgi:predicted MFS family arabinose efflux permease
MSTVSGQSPRVTYRALFTVGEFRVLSGGLLLFTLGFEFEILGLSVLVYSQTGTPLLAALAFSIGFLPQVVGGTLFTSLAGRLPPRQLIAASLLARAVPGLVIGLWPFFPISVMLTLVAVVATLAPVFNAATAGLLPEMLNGDRYVLGRSVLSVIGSGAQILGLGIGGGVLAALSARWLLLAAGGSLVVAAVVARIGLQEWPVSVSSGGFRGAVRATISGNAELLTDRQVRGLLLVQWLPVWFVTGAESLIVPYVVSLGESAQNAGELLAAMPMGMVIGNFVVGRIFRPPARRRLAFPLAVITGAPLLIFAFHLSLPLASGALLISGFGFGYGLGIQRAFLDSVRPALRNQAFGLNATGLMGGQGVIPPVMGWLAAVLGTGFAIMIAGASAVVSAIALYGSLTGRNGVT